MSDNFLSLEFGVGGWEKWKGDKSYIKYVFTVTGDTIAGYTNYQHRWLGLHTIIIDYELSLHYIQIHKCYKDGETQF